LFFNSIDIIYLSNFRNLFFVSSENVNKKNTETSESKLYEDFMERSLIVEKNSYLDDLENIKTYFLKQVNYNLRGVKKNNNEELNFFYKLIVLKI